MTKKIKLIGIIPKNDSTYKDYKRIEEESIKAGIDVPLGTKRYLGSGINGNPLKRDISLQGTILYIKDIPIGVTSIKIIIDKK